MFNKLKLFVESNNIAIHKSRVLLALSGGVDSVVLAHLLNKLGVQFGVAHCNFKLRGQEADDDEQFVKALAHSWSVDFYVTSFNTAQVAKSQGVSIQMAARDLRYNWFEKIRKTHKYDFIATAHHKGDVAETVLFNLTKGTGLEGLHGINPRRGHVIRPLLFADRKEIELYAKSNAIDWREDHSNASVKYSRNKIRHQVIPVLEKINPKTINAIFSTSKRLKETELFLHHVLKNTFNLLVSYKEETAVIDIKTLIEIPGHVYVLNELLKKYGFNYTQAERISEALHGVSGKLFYSSTHILNIDRSTLLITPQKEAIAHGFLEKNEGEFRIGEQNISIRIIENKDYCINKSNKVLALDNSKLKFPLKIREWQRGDFFYPLGMKGKKKLSDFMIDAKIPVNLKHQIRVVLSEEQIVGILNYRLDRRFKIEKGTRTIFEITSK